MKFNNRTVSKLKRARKVGFMKRKRMNTGVLQARRAKGRKYLIDL